MSNRKDYYISERSNSLAKARRYLIRARYLRINWHWENSDYSDIMLWIRYAQEEINHVLVIDNFLKLL